MNTVKKCFCIGFASLLLVGCATTNVPPVSKQDRTLKYDAEYMAAVESASAKAGVDVVWVNPPRNKDLDDD